MWKLLNSPWILIILGILGLCLPIYMYFVGDYIHMFCIGVPPVSCIMCGAMLLRVDYLVKTGRLDP